MKCESCGGDGFLESTEDRIERCDACKTFATDEAAFQHWVARDFLPAIDDWKRAKRGAKANPAAFGEADKRVIDRYRVYRNTNKYLNLTERRAWWHARRAEMEALEALDGVAAVPPAASKGKV